MNSVRFVGSFFVLVLRFTFCSRSQFLFTTLEVFFYIVENLLSCCLPNCLRRMRIIAIRLFLVCVLRNTTTHDKKKPRTTLEEEKNPQKEKLLLCLSCLFASATQTIFPKILLRWWTFSVLLHKLILNLSLYVCAVCALNSPYSS